MPELTITAIARKAGLRTFSSDSDIQRLAVREYISPRTLAHISSSRKRR